MKKVIEGFGEVPINQVVQNRVEFLICGCLDYEASPDTVENFDQYLSDDYKQAVLNLFPNKEWLDRVEGLDFFVDRCHNDPVLIVWGDDTCEVYAPDKFWLMRAYGVV